MKTKELLLGTIVGGISLFFLGWIIYGMAMEGFMAANTNRTIGRPATEMIFWALIVSNLLWGLLLSFINSWSGSLNFSAGAQKGAVAGIIAAIAFNLSTFAMSTFYMNLSVVIVDAIAFAVMTCIAGGLAGWAMGRAARPSAAAAA